MEAMSLSELNEFRLSTRAWLLENCPVSMRSLMPDYERVEGGTNAATPTPMFGSNA